MSDQSNEPASFFELLCDDKLDPLFWRPELVSPLSAWCGHIPFAHWVVQAVQPTTIVELGTHVGVSFSAFCLAVERNSLNTRCWAVDTWNGDEHAGYYGNEVFSTLSNRHKQRFGAFSTLLRCEFNNALPYFADGSIDLLHIDGLHTYEAVKHDFETWFLKLSKRAIVLFHDTNVYRDDFGVWRFWAEVREQYPSFDFLHGHGLGVLAVGTEIPKNISSLFEGLSEVDLARVRERFEFLGERWEAEQHEKFRSSQIELLNARQSDQIDTLSTQVNEARDQVDEVTALLQQRDADMASKQNDLNQLSGELDQYIQDAATSQAMRWENWCQLQSMTDTAEHLKREIAVLQHQSASANTQVGELRQQLIAVQRVSTDEAARRISIENSTVWRLTAPLRQMMADWPWFRRWTRRGAKGLWWLVTLQFPKRLRDRNLMLRKAHLIAESSLFDEAWYRGQYPDATNSSLSASLHFLLSPAGECRNPSPKFDSRYYYEQYPDIAQAQLNALLHYIEHGKGEGRKIASIGDADSIKKNEDDSPLLPEGSVGSWPVDLPAAIPLEKKLEERFAALRPPHVFVVRGETKRITMITDSIGAGSLFGGVGTAIILATLLADRLNANLRLITRTEAPRPDNFLKVLQVHGISWNKNIEFLYVPPDENLDFPIGDEEIILTTSWWTTHCMRPLVKGSRLVYLLQEDERMFYPLGDDQLRCREVLADPDIHFVINTRLLFDHLTKDEQACANIAANGIWFEPSFPAFSRDLSPRRPEDKKQFFFYARPHNARNLYWRGLETIGAAIEQNILDPENWDFNFVGKDLAPIELPRGVKPRLIQNLSWADYIDLVKWMDAGLCLMDTPHPSYPPLDLAAAGAVAVTNRHGRKTSLSMYSDGIICVDPTVKGLCKGLSEAAERADDYTRRAADLRNDRISRNWHETMKPALDWLSGRLEGI